MNISANTVIKPSPMPMSICAMVMAGRAMARGDVPDRDSIRAVAMADITTDSHAAANPPTIMGV